jgi:chromosome segregation ATPase
VAIEAEDFNTRLTDAINRVISIEESDFTNQTTTLSEQITALQDNLMLQIDEHNNRINAIETADYQNQITTIGASLNGRVATLEAANFNAQINDITTRVTELDADFESQVSAVKTITTNNTQRILTLENLVTTQNLSTVQSKIGDLTSQFNVLQTTVQNTSASVDIFGGALSSQQELLVQQNNAIIEMRAQIGNLAHQITNIEAELEAAMRRISDATYVYGNYSLR